MVGDSEQAGVSGLWPVEEDGTQGAGVGASGQMAPEALWARVRRWSGVLSLFSPLSCVQPFCHPMDCNPPGSCVHGISRQEIGSGLPFPSPGIFLTQGSNLHLLHWQADS